MTTTISPPATRPPVLDLDARLALASLAMDDRITHAGLAVDVNSAHIAVDPLPEITMPLPQPAAPCPYRTPIAITLWQARTHLEDRGWCTGALRDEQGAVCLMGAVHAVARSEKGAIDALALLLEAIRRDFPDAESVPRWNDRQRDPFLAFRYLDRGAELAHNRSI
jgi:hypothetical protein